MRDCSICKSCHECVMNWKITSYTYDLQLSNPWLASGSNFRVACHAEKCLENPRKSAYFTTPLVELPAVLPTCPACKDATNSIDLPWRTVANFFPETMLNVIDNTRHVSILNLPTLFENTMAILGIGRFPVPLVPDAFADFEHPRHQHRFSLAIAPLPSPFHIKYPDFVILPGGIRTRKIEVGQRRADVPAAIVLVAHCQPDTAIIVDTKFTRFKGARLLFETLSTRGPAALYDYLVFNIYSAGNSPLPGTDTVDYTKFPLLAFLAPYLDELTQQYVDTFSLYMI